MVDWRVCLVVNLCLFLSWGCFLFSFCNGMSEQNSLPSAPTKLQCSTACAGQLRWSFYNSVYGERNAKGGCGGGMQM